MSRLRYRKNDPGHNVIVAVVKLIESKGGNVVIIGGIELEGIDKYRFVVRVPFTGTYKRPALDTEVTEK